MKTVEAKRRKLNQNENEANDAGNLDGEEAQNSADQNKEEVSLRISPILVLFFVVSMCTMLLLLYFFFDQLGKLQFFI